MNLVLSLDGNHTWGEYQQYFCCEIVSSMEKMEQLKWYLIQQPLPLAEVLKYCQHSSVEQILLLYPSPVEVLAQAFAEQPLGDAVQKTISFIEQLLQIHKQNRRKIRLANLQLLQQQPISSREVLSSMGIQTTAFNARLLPSEFNYLVALQCLRQEHKLQKLLSQLQIASLPMGTLNESTLDLGATITRQQQEKDLRVQLEKQFLTLDAAYNDVRNEKELAELQSRLLQKQLEASVGRTQFIIDQLAATQEQLEQQYLAMKRAENAQNKKFEKEAKKYEKKIKQLTSLLAAEEYKSKQSQIELVLIKSTAIWKSASLMRKVVNKVRRKGGNTEQLKSDSALLLTSEYFDAEWYLQTYPDIAEADVNPAEHYILFGADEGRQPSPKFDGQWYLQSYKDVAQSGANPLLHFIKFGLGEGRQASPTLLVTLTDEKDV